MVIAQRDLTLQQFLRLPERKPALEYEDGEVVQKVSPKAKHGLLQGELWGLFRGIGGRAILAFVELRVTFGGKSVVPDLAVFLHERVPLDPDGSPQDDIFIPPDLAVEIASPRQPVNRLVRRCLWYVENGVQIALLVDVYDQSVVLFRAGAQPQALRGDDPIELSDVVPGFAVTVAALFASLRVR